MPAYSFKERFVPMIKDGTKTQTVRAYRNNNPRPGQFAHLFYGMRTKHCTRLLPPQTITDVNTIWILDDTSVYLCKDLLPQSDAEFCKENDEVLFFAENTTLLTDAEKDLFAWLDGFRPAGSTKEKPAGAFDLMFSFWEQNNELPFTGTVTYWK